MSEVRMSIDEARTKLSGMMVELDGLKVPHGAYEREYKVYLQMQIGQFQEAIQKFDENP